MNFDLCLVCTALLLKPQAIYQLGYMNTVGDFYLTTEDIDTSHQWWRKFMVATATTILMLFASGGWGADEEMPVLQGIVEPHPAPGWDILEWLNSDPGSVESNRDSVIVIDFFQLGCPGCNTFTAPLMQQWQNRFSDEISSGDLLLLKIHTVFEGHNYQTVHRLKQYIEEKGVTMPVGVDRHRDDYLPETKKRYRTKGTPEIVIIDRNGMIRFQQFGFFEPAAAEKYIDFLLGGSGSPKRQKPVEVCLASDLCGQ